MLDIDNISEKLAALDLDFIMNRKYFEDTSPVSNHGELKIHKSHRRQLQLYFFDPEMYLNNAAIQITGSLYLDNLYDQRTIFPFDNFNFISLRGHNEVTQRRGKF